MEEPGLEHDPVSLSNALAADHHHVLRGGLLEEDLPSDLLDSALLDSHHNALWSAGLGHDHMGSDSSESSSTGPAAVNHQHQEQHAGVPTSYDQARTDSSPKSSDAAACSSFPSPVSALSAAVAGQPDAACFERGLGAMEGAAATGESATASSSLLGAGAPVGASSATAAQRMQCGGQDALEAPNLCEEDSSAGSSDTDAGVPDIDNVLPPPAGASQDHTQHQQHRLHAGMGGGLSSCAGGGGAAAAADRLWGGAYAAEQGSFQEPWTTSGHCSDGGAMPPSAAAEAAAAAPPLPALSPAMPAAATVSGAAVDASAAMFASACSSWHTCASASTTSSARSALWRPAGPRSSCSEALTGAHAAPVAPPALQAAGCMGAGSVTEQPVAALPPPPPPSSDGGVVGSSGTLPLPPPLDGNGVGASILGDPAEGGPTGNAKAAAAGACSAEPPVALPPLAAAVETQAASASPLQGSVVQCALFSSEAAAGEQVGPLGASVVALADAAAATGMPAHDPAASAVSDGTSSPGHLHQLLPYPAPLSPQGGSLESLPVSAAAAYPMASMMVRESQLEDVSLSMSLARDAWPPRSSAPPQQRLPPAAARAVQAAALALTESSYDAAAGPLGAGALGMAGGCAAPRTGGPGSSSNSRVTDGSSSSSNGTPAAAGASSRAGWRLPTQVWGVSGALQQLGQQAAVAARGIATSAGLVSSTRRSQAAPAAAAAPAASSSTTWSSNGAGAASAMGGEVVTEEGAVLVGQPTASGVEFDEDRGMVVVQHSPDMPQSVDEMEAEQFRGLLYCDGRDSHGRPVLVVDVDRIPAGAHEAPREAALSYLLRHAMPLVMQGSYVLVLVASQAGPPFGLLPSWWCVRTYRALSRPFKKHVRFVVLVRPNILVRTILALISPFVSPKAHHKVKQVDHLLDIDLATRGEVQVAHLGESFLSAVQRLPALSGPR